MLRLLERLLGLSSHELRRALPLFAFLFLTMASTVASKATRDALFLDRYRAIDLAYADIAIALLVTVAVSLYIRIGEHVSLRALQVGSLLVFAASATGFWWLSLQAGGREGGALFAVLYVWVGVFSVLAPSQVWTLANFVLTTREAKRSFGLIGSGAILGWIVGGAATRVTAGTAGTENLLLWVAVSLLASAGIVEYVWRRTTLLGSGDGGSDGEPRSGVWSSLRLIHRSPYLRAIAAVIFLSSFATTIVGWQFKVIAKSYIPDTDDLAAFFGTFNMVAGLASLGLQLLLTGRLLKRFGVGLALFIVPVAMALTSASVVLFGTLLAMAAAKASDQVLRYSIDKATVELLYLPVPASQTFRVKSFIDTVVYRFGDAMGGTAVLIFAAWLHFTPMQMSWVALAVIGGWLTAAAIGRTQYVENLRESIHQHRLDAERQFGPVIERATSDLLVSKLHGNPAEILYALSLFEATHAGVAHPAVRALLRHASPEVRSRAVAFLASVGDISVKDEVEGLLRDEHLDVRTEALLYLTRHGSVDPVEKISALGDFPDFSIRAALVAFLARPGKGQNLDAARVMLAAMAEDTGPDGGRARLEAARLLARLPDAFERELRMLLDDKDPDVVRAAVKAVGDLRKRPFLDTLIARLDEPWLVNELVEALAKFGDRIVGTLRDFLVDGSVSLAVRREVPLVLQAIATPAAQYVLNESVLDADTVLRYRIITALNKLAQEHPERRMDRKVVETVLAAEVLGHYRSYQMLTTLGAELTSAEGVVEALRESMQHEAERIFRLLKIMYPEHDLHSAYVGIRSTDPVVHDNALEFLENILAPPIRESVLPLFDRDVTPAQRADLATQRMGAPLGSRDETVELMAASGDAWLMSCAAFAVGEMKLTHLAHLLDKWLDHDDPLLRTTALDARDKLTQNAGGPAAA